MCEPTTLFALSVASSAATGLLNYQAQSAQADYQNELAIQQTQNATNSMIDQSRQLALRDIQEEHAAAQKYAGVKREAAQAVSAVRTSAGEGGAAGLSLAALERDFYMQEQQNYDVINQNLTYQRQQSAMDSKGIHSQAVSRRNQAASSMKAGPSFLGTALQIGGDTLNAGQNYLGWGA